MIGLIVVRNQRESYCCAIRILRCSVQVFPFFLRADLSRLFFVGDRSEAVFYQSIGIVRVRLFKARPFYRLCQFILDFYCFTGIIYLIFGKILECRVPGFAFKSTDFFLFQRSICRTIQSDDICLSSAAQSKCNMRSGRRFSFRHGIDPLFIRIYIYCFNKTDIFVSDHIRAGCDVSSTRHVDIDIPVVDMSFRICCYQNCVAVIDFTRRIRFQWRHEEIA